MLTKEKSELICALLNEETIRPLGADAYAPITVTLVKDVDTPTVGTNGRWLVRYDRLQEKWVVIWVGRGLGYYSSIGLLG